MVGMERCGDVARRWLCIVVALVDRGMMCRFFESIVIKFSLFRTTSFIANKFSFNDGTTDAVRVVFKMDPSREVGRGVPSA